MNQTPRYASALPAAASSPPELAYSLAVVVILSGVYIAYEILAEPHGGHPLGHSLGIVGTLLMVMTEVLYSLRKRTRLLNWAGPVRYWLSFHIFTGIVGPFLVLMHTGLQFRGLAGVSFLLTAVVVGSGFVGRYLYTALPRTLSGVAISRRELEEEIVAGQADLAHFETEKTQQVQQLVQQLSRRDAAGRSDLVTVLGRGFFQWRYRRRLRRALRSLAVMEKSQRRQLEQLLARQRELERQRDMLAAAHRLLRYWHLLHVPLGLTLFFSVIIHIVATLYFRAGLFAP